MRIRRVVSSFVLPLRATASDKSAAKLSSILLQPNRSSNNQHPQEQMKFPVFKRSKDVSTYQGKYAACSGHIEAGETAPQAALRELSEETGIQQLEILRAGRPIFVRSQRHDSLFVVHPFLVGHYASENSKISTGSPADEGSEGDDVRAAMFEREVGKDWLSIDWEHTEWKMTTYAGIRELEKGLNTVPMLVRAFETVGLSQPIDVAKSHGRPLFSPESIHEVLEAIDSVRFNKSDGSASLAETALRGLAALRCDHVDSKLSTSVVKNVLDLSFSLAYARPSMVTIGIRVARAVKRALVEPNVNLVDSRPCDIVATLRDSATREIGALRSAGETIAATYCGANVASSPIVDSLMTISMSSTVLKAFEMLPRKSTVVVCESRPSLEGARLAEMLARSGLIKPVLCTDAAAFQAAKIFSTQQIVIGADAIWVEEDTGAIHIVNKVGTSMLDALARVREISTFVLVDTTKIVLLDEYHNIAARASELEEGPSEQIVEPEWQGIIEGFNPTFESLEVLTGEASANGSRIQFVTERGLTSEEALIQIARENSEVLAWLGSDGLPG